MDMNNLRDVYFDQLKDMHSAEKQLTEALPKMLDKASSPELRRAIQEHLAVTERQLARVARLLESNNVNAGGKKCKAMEGLIEEATEIMKKDGDSDAIDAGMIAAAQKVEHYEIASYGTLVAWAKTIGANNDASTLQEILDEEYMADRTLTGIAESHLNREAR